MPKVHLILTGILTLQRFEVAQGQFVWRIVIPDGMPHPHEPHLLVETSRLSQGTASRVKNFNSSHNHQFDVSIIDLKKNVVWIDGATPALGADAVLPNQMLLVSDLAGTGRLKAPDAIPYAAVVRVDLGTPFVTWTDPGKHWDVGSNKKGVLLAEEVCIRFDWPEEVLRLNLGTSVDGSIADGDMTITETFVISPDAAGRIEVRIANLPPAEVTPKKPVPISTGPSHHPKHYAEMVDKPQKPVSIGKTKGGTGGFDPSDHGHRLTLIPDPERPPSPSSSSATIRTPAGSDCPPGGADQGP